MAEKGSQSQDFFWQHREYHSWESTEENDTTHGGSWGGGGAWGPPLAYGLHVFCLIFHLCYFMSPDVLAHG